MNAKTWIETAPIDRLDAELIVAHVLRKDRIFLHAHPDFTPDKAAQEEIDALAERRASGEPLAYILGVKQFYGRDFKVTPDTLIPRPETEALVDEAIRLKPQMILDVGTGSGCIAITIAKELPEAKIAAVDISEPALKIAEENAQKHRVRVDFRRSDLLSACGSDEKYDLITANLPYVSKNWDWLGEELRFEPQIALYAADEGLALIKELIRQTPVHLNRGGYLLLEADPSQHGKIRAFARQTGNFSPIEVADETAAWLLVLCLR